MDSPLLAVIVYDHPEPFGALTSALNDLGVETYGVRTWDAAKVLIGQYRPLVVFVELTTWHRIREDIIATASEADQAFAAVVVGPLPDIELYVSTIEQGAFNFVAPPFSQEALSLALHSAATDTKRRRETDARASNLSHDFA
jgi:DNA-binding NtrC family response regulator